MRTEDTPRLLVQKTQAQRQAWLLWNEERGLRYPRLATSQALPSEAAESCLGPGSPILCRGAGAAHPRLVCVLSVRANDERLIQGEARSLMLRMLTAMQLNPARDVYLLGLCTHENGRPLAETTAYQHALAAELAEQRPKALIVFGASTLARLAPPELDFAAVKNQSLELPELAYEGHLMPLWHPDEILAEPSRRRETWQALCALMPFLG